jgi:hypothetical protein
VMALKKVCAQRSWRMAMRRQSLSLPSIVTRGQSAVSHGVSGKRFLRSPSAILSSATSSVFVGPSKGESQPASRWPSFWVCCSSIFLVSSFRDRRYLAGRAGRCLGFARGAHGQRRHRYLDGAKRPCGSPRKNDGFQRMRPPLI